MLEIASGTGEHAAHLAAAFPHLEFQPTDPDAEARASIDAWRAELALANLRPAIALDAQSASEWPPAHADAILCINMIHISPWAATQGLIAGASPHLPSGGLLYLYGPYRRAGIPTAPSNDVFRCRSAPPQSRLGPAQPGRRRRPRRASVARPRRHDRNAGQQPLRHLQASLIARRNLLKPDKPSTVVILGLVPSIPPSAGVTFNLRMPNLAAPGSPGTSLNESGDDRCGEDSVPIENRPLASHPTKPHDRKPLQSSSSSQSTGNSQSGTQHTMSR